MNMHIIHLRAMQTYLASDSMPFSELYIFEVLKSEVFTKLSALGYGNTHLIDVTHEQLM